MAAPTPVSAYLHAASMVKAGVYLVALLAPGVRRRDRMAHGAPGARPRDDAPRRRTGAAPARPQAAARLRHRQPARLPGPRPRHRHPQRDARRARPRSLAHALFKATLFLVVGVIDRSTGTRDLRELTGLGRRLPRPRGRGDARRRVDGRPPAAARLRRQGERARRARRRRPRRRRHRDRYDGRLGAASSAWSLGSILTAAYSARFVWGAFGNRDVPAPRVGPRPLAGVRRRPPSCSRRSRWCSASSAPRSPSLLAPEVDEFPPGVHEPSSRCGTASGSRCVLTVVTLAAGALLFVAREPVGPHAGRAGPRLEPRAGLPRRDAPARPHGRRGHRCRAARLRGGVPRHHPDRAWSCCRARRCSAASATST